MKSQDSPKCKSCGHQISGNYCSFCGEKIVEPKDLELKSLISNAIGAFTNIDSRLLRSLKALIFNPGKLSKLYVTGQRIQYVKPFQLFLLVNILFFFVLSEMDIFRTPSKWFFQEDFDGYPVMSKVRSLQESTGLTQEQIANLYDQRSSSLSKGLLFTMIPMIAGFLALLLRKSKHAFGKHLIFTTHYLTFTLLFTVIWSVVAALLFKDIPHKWIYILPILLGILLYLMGAFKQFYETKWGNTILKACMLFTLIVLGTQVYRVAINIISISSL